MPILDPASLGIEPCSCGRLSNKAHCPFCGAYTLYGTARRAAHVDKTTGRALEYTVYKCRRCASYFDDWQWRNECAAPRFVTKAKAAAEAHAARMRQPMAPVQVEALNAINKKRGLPLVNEFGDEVEPTPDSPAAAAHVPTLQEIFERQAALPQDFGAAQDIVAPDANKQTEDPKA